MTTGAKKIASGNGRGLPRAVTRVRCNMLLSLLSEGQYHDPPSGDMEYHIRKDVVLKKVLKGSRKFMACMYFLFLLRQSSHNDLTILK